MSRNRHLPQTERISVGVLYEIFVEGDDCTLQYQASGEHKCDMFTKRFDPASFEVAVAGMNMIFKSALRSSGGGCVVAAHVHDHQDCAPFSRGLCCSCTWTITSDAAGCNDHLLLTAVSPIFLFPCTALLVG